MKRFGNFEAVDAIASSPGKSVHSARNEASAGFVVKVMHLAHFADGDPRRVEELSAAFYRTTELQKKVAEQSEFVAPILLYGLDGEAAWYVTNAFPNSAQKIISSKNQLSRENIYKIVDSVVRGAMALKEQYGRPHGNLKPSNIFFTGNGKPQLGQVVLADAAPGDGAQADRFEFSDLRAIGELIYRLVYPGDSRDPNLWKLSPDEPAQEWKNVFGKEAKGWAGLCQKLLNPRLAGYNLERLALDLLKLNPRRGITPILAGAVAALAIGAIGGFVFMKYSHAKGKPPVRAEEKAAVMDEATRLKHEEEKRQLSEEKRLAEELAAARAAEAKEKTEAAESARIEAAQKLAEAERLQKEIERQRRETEAKLKELAAQKSDEETRNKVAQEQLLRAKAEETRRALELAERAKTEASEKAAREERLRREAELKSIEAERRAKELAAELARKEREAVATTLAENNTSAAEKSEETSRVFNSQTPRPGEGWANSLGMKFVPLSNSKILICAWETRRKDFEEFARASRYNSDLSWKKTSFKQSASQPIVNVTFAEAEAFCQWLTKTERDLGLLTANQSYRLPTDSEWIAASGADAAKSSYPWGNAWPPPAGSGNYASTCSYDRFEMPAPVAQFIPNTFGLYDMAGNVWEMCSSAGQKNCHGGSWLSAVSEQLALGYQLPWSGTERREDIGFRCVLTTN